MPTQDRETKSLEMLIVNDHDYFFLFVYSEILLSKSYYETLWLDTSVRNAIADFFFFCCFPRKKM